MTRFEDCFVMSKKMADAIFQYPTYDTCANSFSDKKDKKTLRDSMIKLAIAIGEPDANIRGIYLKFRSDTLGFMQGERGLVN